MSDEERGAIRCIRLDQRAEKSTPASFVHNCIECGAQVWCDAHILTIAQRQYPAGVDIVCMRCGVPADVEWAPSQVLDMQAMGLTREKIIRNLALAKLSDGMAMLGEVAKQLEHDDRMRARFADACIEAARFTDGVLRAN